MKTIIAGSRDIFDYKVVETAIYSCGFWQEITEVVSGNCRGIDKLGELWAKENNIEIKTFPAYWKEYGKAAGPIRNEQMAKYADALIAVWDGQSIGTKNMIETADKYFLKIYVFNIKRELENEKDY